MFRHSRNDCQGSWEVIPEPRGPSPFVQQVPAVTTTVSPGWGSGVRKFTEKRIVYIIAGLLIPGRGEPKPNQAVIAIDGKIEYVGDQSLVPPEYDSIVPVHVPYLLPGFWECHGHFIGPSPDSALTIGNVVAMSPAEAAARAVRSAYDTLSAGFTSLIELGGYGAEIKKVIDEGSILGPNIYPAGGAISMTAGHGDAFELPVSFVWQRLKPDHQGSDISSPFFIMADGIDECRKAVRLNLRRGAKVIKVFTSGGVVSRDDDPRFQQFSDEELSIIVTEAARMGLVCTAHAESKAGIMAAIRAGFKVIQHAAECDEEVIEAMKSKDIMAVFTATPVESFNENKKNYPKHIATKMEAMIESHRRSYRLGIKAGIRIALGSDLFEGPGQPLGAGANARELIFAVEAGMTPLQAIESATANGPLTLGPNAPQSGQIRVGYDADFIAMECNPLNDITVLRNPRNIRWIWKACQLVKAPGMNPFDLLLG